jgi:hypothetical protein
MMPPAPSTPTHPKLDHGKGSQPEPGHIVRPPTWLLEEDKKNQQVAEEGKSIIKKIDLTEYQSPEARGIDLGKAFASHVKTSTWDEAKKDYPQLWMPLPPPKEKADAKFEALNSASVPEAVVQSVTNKIRLRQKADSDSIQQTFVEVVTFTDAGNCVADLLSKRRLLELGYRLDDLDKSTEIKFLGATGGCAHTLGSIEIDACVSEDEAPQKLKFEIWEGEVEFADVLLMGGNDQPVDNGPPAFLVMFPMQRSLSTYKTCDIDPYLLLPSFAYTLASQLAFFNFTTAKF